MSQSTYDREKALAICERLENEPSLGLRQILRDAAVPEATFREWRKANPELDEAYKTAKLEGFDNLAHESLTIVDTPPERIATEHGDKIDPSSVAWQKNRADQRNKLLAKWYPAKYGDKLDLNHGGNVGFSLTVNRRKP